MILSENHRENLSGRRLGHVLKSRPVRWKEGPAQNYSTFFFFFWSTNYSTYLIWKSKRSLKTKSALTRSPSFRRGRRHWVPLYNVRPNHQLCVAFCNLLFYPRKLPSIYALCLLFTFVYYGPGHVLFLLVDSFR